MSKTRKRALAAILAASVVAIGGSVVYAASGGGGSGVARSVDAPEAVALTGTCKAGNTSFRTSEAGAATRSTTYVDVPETEVSFSWPKRKSCLLVEYSAYVFAAEPDKVIFVRALLDGATVGSPSQIQLSGDDDEDDDGWVARQHTFFFAFQDVPAGPHTVKIQWREGFNGGTIFTHRHSTVVHHR